MTFIDILNTVFEFALIGTFIWGVFNEHRLVALERKIKAYFRRKTFKIIRNAECGIRN